MNTLELYFEGQAIGLVSDIQGDFPWRRGRFQAYPVFDRVEEIFERELSLLSTNEAEWESLWDEIESRGLYLKVLGTDERIDRPLLHIEGQEIWWRD